MTASDFTADYNKIESHKLPSTVLYHSEDDSLIAARQDSALLDLTRDYLSSNPSEKTTSISTTRSAHFSVRNVDRAWCLNEHTQISIVSDPVIIGRNYYDLARRRAKKGSKEKRMKTKWSNCERMVQGWISEVHLCEPSETQPRASTARNMNPVQTRNNAAHVPLDHSIMSRLLSVNILVSW